jgi:methionine aminotransferase
VEYARWLTCERGVASIPVSVFYRDPPRAQWLRFCFAKDADTLRAAADILCSI